MFDDFVDDDDLIESDGEEVWSPASASLPPPRENPDMLRHEEIEQSLLSLQHNKNFPHALIFSGPMGVGKATMAFRLARFLLSQSPNGEEEGGLFGESDPKPAATTLYIAPESPVFKRVASGGHADLRTIERAMDEKKGVRKGVVDIDSIRKIAPFLRMSSSDGGWRIVIVDEADTMNRYAQNAILKILEEPPPKALLILICNRLGTMIPTIRSRCRTFHFQALDKDTLSTLLKRGAPDATTSEIALLSALSDGSMGRALTMHEEKGANTLNTILAFLENWKSPEWSKIHPMADTLSRPDSEKAYTSFVTIMEWVAQSLLRAKATNDHGLPEILKSDALKTLQNHYSLEQWIDICEKLSSHFIAIDRSNLDKRHGVIGAFAILCGQI